MKKHGLPDSWPSDGKDVADLIVPAEADVTQFKSLGGRAGCGESGRGVDPAAPEIRAGAEGLGCPSCCPPKDREQYPHERGPGQGVDVSVTSKLKKLDNDLQRRNPMSIELARHISPEVADTGGIPKPPERSSCHQMQDTDEDESLEDSFDMEPGPEVPVMPAEPGAMRKYVL
jgi:hypothetical protein